MLNYIFKFLLLIILFFSLNYAKAQNAALLYGTVQDSAGDAVANANIEVLGLKLGTLSDKDGNFDIVIPSDKALVVRISYLGNYTRRQIPALINGEEYELNVIIASNINLTEVSISEEQVDKRTNLEIIDARDIAFRPTLGNGVEAALRTLPGVSAFNELSSSYSVRGGNFDENLIYINDIEVYRPFLIRAGQQEGLSIINPNMVESIEFSAGGFEARFGDKLSSVLNITYKEADSFAGTFSGSLLGANAHVEGASENKRFTYLVGARYQSNSYLLNSLPTQGDYSTRFADFQTFLTYDITDEWQLNFLNSSGFSRYSLVPENRVTDFGTPNEVLRLRIFFDGSENMEYQTLVNAVSLIHRPDRYTESKFIVSAYTTFEFEHFDILGQYFLSEVDTDPGSETFQEEIASLGVGTYLNHARNDLGANIFNIQYKGKKEIGGSILQWGAKVQNEIIRDELRQWRYLDSAGYSIPHSNEDTIISLDEFVRNDINLNSIRYTAYLQNSFTLDDSSNAYLTLGARANYWDYNQEFFITPRFQLFFEPNLKHNKRQVLRYGDSAQLKSNIRFKFTGGMYYQPPFYREFRDRQGQLNPNIQAQRSYHIVAGSDVQVKIFGNPFIWSTEIYYKHLDRLIPYDIEDVRIRYFAENNAVGYATGIDLKLSGEFIRGLPSWASISLMQTKEDIAGDTYMITNESGERVQVENGYLRRPTDQRLQFGLYFEDFLPNNPDYKLFLNFLYGTNLPYGPPESTRFRNQLKTDAFNRLDIGFSRQIGKEALSKSKTFKHFNAIWISAEVFNLFNIQNTISHFWVKDVNNNLWAVPNYLTTRRFNLKVTFAF